MNVSGSYPLSSPFFAPLSTADAPAWLMDLTGAIDRRDEDGVKRQLTINDAKLKPDTLHGLLARVYCGTACSLSIKRMLASHPKTDATRALQLAVEHDDRPFVEQLLKEGADPYAGHLFPRSTSMRAMLQFPRRLAILYPGPVQTDETKLDQALREGRMVDAHHLLDFQGDVLGAWRDAVRDNKVDIQRALLLLGYCDNTVRFRLKEDEIATIQDPGVKKLMKEIAYYSPKRGEPENSNGVVRGILCRHLVADQLRRKEAEKNRKSHFDHYRNPEEIARHVSADDKGFKRLKAHATESYLIDNRKFGQFLVQQFEAMEGAGESTKLMLMGSTNHAMELSLRIKYKDGKKVYVTKLFDPNRTTTHARSASTSLRAFEFQDLRRYLDGNNLSNLYCPEPKGVSLLFVYPGEDALTAMASLPPGAAPDRQLTSCIPDEEIDVTAAWHLMTNGFAADLRRLKGEIVRRPVAERITLLAAKDADGTPGLCMTFQNGHAGLIEAYAELLPLIPEEQWAELLAAKTASGTPGLLLALLNGHAEAVETFGKLLPLLPKKLYAELLAAKRADGTPGLYMALQNGHAAAVEAFGKLLPLIPEEQRAELLAAKTASGTPGLFLALQNGHAAAVEAFGKLLRWIPEEQRAELLVAKRANKDTALSMALRNGHIAAIEAYWELLPLIPIKQRAELLAAKRTNGASGLYLALQYGHAGAIKAYGKFLPLIPIEQRAELLAAKDSDGMPGVFQALQEGHVDAVDAVGELLQWIPEEQRVELLAAKDSDGTPWFSRVLWSSQPGAVEAFGKLLLLIPIKQRAEILATKDDNETPVLSLDLQDGNADAVEMFGKLLRLVSKEQRAELLAAKDAHGTPGLFWALQNGHADVVEAFGNLLPLIPVKRRAELLAAKDAHGTPGLFRALQGGHTDAVEAFGNLLQWIPEEEHAELLAAKDAEGTFGILAALENEHVDTVEAYEKLLP